MSHPRNPRDPSPGNTNEESGPSESSYFPSVTAHATDGQGPAPPLEPTGDTLVASTADIPASAATPITEHPPRIPAPAPAASNPFPPSQARSVPFRSARNQPSAIRLRRLRAPSVSGSSPLRTISSNPQQFGSTQQRNHDAGDSAVTGRRRSSSEPLSPGAVAHPTIVNMDPMPVVPEGQTPPMYVAEGTTDGRGGGDNQQRHIVIPRRFMIRRRRADRPPPIATTDEDCYDSRVVDFLDVVDPEVATLSSITNIQNSLFVPSLGRLVNRRPTYDLSQLPFIPGAFPPPKEDVSTIKEEGPSSSSEGTADEAPMPVRRTHSISTVLTANTPQYAILPDDPDHTLEGWSEEDIKLLNDHVRHLLHSRRSKIKQRFKGFLKYASRPLGFLVTLHATLITLFGLAWVLFLIGWIYVGEKQLYVIDVIDNVLVALFAVMGDGLIPWRLYDTYNMLWIAHYHRKTLKLRKKLLLPKLEDKNDLPIDQNDPSARMVDLEAARALPKRGAAGDYFPVLTEEEQAKLVHYQAKLAKSHTFYKPHETSTHRAFPHRLAMTIILLLDLHSCLQVSLGTVTWSIPYERRPAAATTTILCCSITVNALAGILISVGDRRTRKKDVVERLVRQELTGEVMDRMVKEKRREKEMEEEEERKRDKEKEKEGEKEKEKGLLGMSLSDFTGGGSSSKESSKTRTSSEEGGRGEGRGGRRSLDALTEGLREGFRRRSVEGRGGADASETSIGRKQKDRVGRFDPSTRSGSGTQRSPSGGNGNSNGPGSVVEADHEPHHEHVRESQRQQGQGRTEQQASVEKRKDARLV